MHIELVLAQNEPEIFGAQSIWWQRKGNQEVWYPQYVVSKPGTSGTRYPRVYIYIGN